MSDGFFEQFNREEVIKQGSERGFAIVFACVGAIVGAVSLYLGSATWPYWFAGAAIILAIGFTVPKILKWPNRLWLKFGLLLAMIIQPLSLVILFFVAVTPTGILMRAFGNDPLKRKYDPKAESYWISRRKPESAEPGPYNDMKNQF